MGCGCGRNKNAPRRSQTNMGNQFNSTIRPTAQPNMAENRAAAITGSPVPFARKMMNSDRLRIERLRRDAINQSRGNTA